MSYLNVNSYCMYINYPVKYLSRVKFIWNYRNRVLLCYIMYTFTQIKRLMNEHNTIITFQLCSRSFILLFVSGDVTYIRMNRDTIKLTHKPHSSTTIVCSSKLHRPNTRIQTSSFAHWPLYNTFTLPILFNIQLASLNPSIRIKFTN